MGRLGVTRLALASLASSALALAIGWGFAAWSLQQPWADPARLMLHYFLVPLIAAGLVAALLSEWLFGRTSDAGKRWPGAVPLAGTAAGLVALWLLAMHAGLWFEWQDKRSALAYGSEWFYAEVYFDYLLGGRGTAVSVAVGAAVLLPLLMRAAYRVAARLLGGERSFTRS